ncbi:MAG TPA: Hint domain-containing protein [Acidisphaera sp.]|nr:Hint domain-containing protein [Acidisphaera sp.]
MQDTAIPCFVTGARILTARGEVPVEGLRVGDQAMALLAGGLRRIRWIGHRRLDLRTHPKPETVHPISVSAGAFADGSPHRDLWLSPGHFVFVDGVLIQISKLVNGATIVQVPRHEVTYWHVELDQHDVLLAEGLQVESYLDTGNRNAFANAESFVELHPDFMPKHWTETCAPLAMSGPQITAVQARLLRRATEELGYAITYDCDLHLVVDGQIVSACEAEIGQYRFGLPAGASDIRLMSRVSVPAHMVPGSHDTRPLGVRVSRIRLDDAHSVPLDRPDLDDGWHGLESDDIATWRWTAGAARLPAGARTISIELIGDRTYTYWDRAALCGTESSHAIESPFLRTAPPSDYANCARPAA